MLPARPLRRGASLSLPSSSLALATRRPAFSTACAPPTPHSRRLINCSPVLGYPRSSRHVAYDPTKLGREERAQALASGDKQAASSSSSTGTAGARKAAAPRPVLPKAWVGENVIVPVTQTQKLADAGVSPTCADDGAGAAQASESVTPSKDASSSPADAPAEVSSAAAPASDKVVPEARQDAKAALAERGDLLPSESTLESLKATLISSLLCGALPMSSSGSGDAQEPVVGVYSPHEDAGVTAVETMHEVVARLGGELVTLDAVELCAEGEGKLGRATSAINLQPNPLKIRSSSSQGISSFSNTGANQPSKFAAEDEFEEDEEDEDDDHFDIEDGEEDDYHVPESRADRESAARSHAVGASEHTRNSRKGKRFAEKEGGEDNEGAAASLVGQSKTIKLPAFSLRPTEQSKLDSLFTEIVDAPAPQSSPTSSASRPRFIFVKDAQLVASTFDTPNSWYAALKRAVQTRRSRGQPTAIVLGLGPDLLEPRASFVAAPIAPPPTLPEGLEQMMPPDYLAKHTEAMKRMSAYIPVHFLKNTVDEASRVNNPDSALLVLQKRISCMASEEWGSLIPAFSTSGSSSSFSGNGDGPQVRFMSPNGAGGPLGGLPGMLSNALSKGNVAVMEFPFVPAGSSSLKDLLANASNGLRPFGGSSSFGSSASSSSNTGPQKIIWKMVGIHPRAWSAAHSRKFALARADQRVQINSLLFAMALSDLRGKLVGPAPFSRTLPSSPSSTAGGTNLATPETPANSGGLALASDISSLSISERAVLSVLPWETVVTASGAAVGIALAQQQSSSTSIPPPAAADAPVDTPATASSDSTLAGADLSSRINSDDRISISWEQVNLADSLAAKVRAEFKQLHKDGSSPSSTSVLASTASDAAGKEEKEKEEEPDATVEALKTDHTLNKYEKKVLSTIVDRRGLREGFEDVHLPEKTIDAIRSVVSLPLLFPEAFSTGILKNHATSGALLFGPPGTGKTLVVRALAKESGARMMSIQPSDVMDMYFGEAEKLVKAVFSVARRLSPCIVFIDELDALFEARSGGSKGGGDSARRQMLTEFMQEMDGLSSASKNKDRGLIVIGATNRPQDLDEAVLRRLPRRLMIDLPAEKEREAILRLLLKSETLADDVDLAKLAKDTATFSGSDLKHLCVMAAQEAIKELYSVPWASKKADSTPPTESSSSASSSAPSSDKPAKQPIDIPVIPDGQAPPPPKELEAVPAQAAVKEPAVERVAIFEGGDAPATASASSGSAPTTAAQLTPPSPPPATGETQAESATPADAAIGTSMPDVPASPAPPSPEEPASPPARAEPKPRVLTKAHFEYALKNSSSSGSEELGALPELRKWNEQFGDAGTKKNKRSGFGKSFGFGERETKKA